MKRRGKRGKRIFVITIILITMWMFGVYLYITYKNIDINTNYNTTRLQSTNIEQTVENVEKESQSVVDMIEKETQSVVGISKLKNAGGSIFSNNTEEQLGLGTGVIISPKGYILSNSHVTGEKHSVCYITLDTGITYDGKVVWADSDLDLSITKINAKDLKSVNLANSDLARPGETVFAIGNPIGFEFRRTVTSGIISATNRTIKIEEEENKSYMSNLIQTDATINPGNSGGPLILPNGDVVGINTVKISSAEGIGFAVPINVVKKVIKSFEETDDFKESFIGVLAYDREVIPYLSGFSATFDRGIYVAQITPNGPASKTDLEEGDIINSIDGVEINTMISLREFIYGKKPGDTVKLAITRGKINKTIDVVLGER